MPKRSNPRPASVTIRNRVGRIGARRTPRTAASSQSAVRQPSIVERDGSFFWRDAETGGLIGPFTSMQAAAADRDSPDSVDEDLLEAADSDDLHDAASEIGIEDFIDPDSGEPMHGYEPHVRDDH